MVKILIEEDKKLYQCEECGFHYESKEWAERLVFVRNFC